VRRCLGASFAQYEMRIVLRAIVERAQLRPAHPRPEALRPRNITLAPSRGTRVVLERPVAVRAESSVIAALPSS
jgi:cytochrome P450